MTIEYFSRRYDLPASTVRRVVSLTPRDCYVNIGVERSKGRGRIHVVDSHLLRTAIVRHVGAGALSVNTLERLAVVVSREIARADSLYRDDDQTQVQTWKLALQRDGELLAALLHDGQNT